MKADNALTKLKIFCARDHSTARAADLIFNFYNEIDDELTPEETEQAIGEILEDEALENPHFFIQSIDWPEVHARLQTRLEGIAWKINFQL